MVHLLVSLVDSRPLLVRICLSFAQFVQFFFLLRNFVIYLCNLFKQTIDLFKLCSLRCLQVDRRRGDFRSTRNILEGRIIFKLESWIAHFIQLLREGIDAILAAFSHLIVIFCKGSASMRRIADCQDSLTKSLLLFLQPYKLICLFADYRLELLVRLLELFDLLLSVRKYKQPLLFFLSLLCLVIVDVANLTLQLLMLLLLFFHLGVLFGYLIFKFTQTAFDGHLLLEVSWRVQICIQCLRSCRLCTTLLLFQSTVNFLVKHY